MVMIHQIVLLKHSLDFTELTPTVARKEQLMIKSFAPLKIQFTLKGGSTMDYKIIEKEVFTVLR